MGNKIVIWKQMTKTTEVFSSSLRTDHTHWAKAHNAKKCYIYCPQQYNFIQQFLCYSYEYK